MQQEITENERQEQEEQIENQQGLATQIPT